MKPFISGKPNARFLHFGKPLWIAMLSIYLISLSTQARSHAVRQHLTIELGIVCDYQFTSAFHLNEKLMTEYWVHQIGAVETNFETLSSTRISFVITSVIFIQDPVDQPFFPTTKSGTFSAADITTILQDFSKWAFSLNTSDVYLLATGVETNGPHASYQNGLCVEDAEKRLTKSVVVVELRLGYMHVHSSQVLTVALSKLLGLSLYETKCTSTDYFMSGGTGLVNSYYFSNCSDSLIANFTSSRHANCLRTFHFTNSGTVPNFTTRALSADLQCRMQLRPETLAFTEQDNNGNCENYDCNRGKLVKLLHNTPCGIDKVCFRGICMPHGNILKNLEYGKCLLSSRTSLLNEKPQLQPCPKYGLTFDGIILGKMYQNGTILRSTHNAREQKFKCLSLLPGSTAASFVTCDQTPDQLWDLIEVNNSNEQFVLGHRRSRKFISVNSQHNIVLAECLDIQVNTATIWTFHPPGKNLSEKVLSANSDIAIWYRCINITIKLMLVCDQECGKRFYFVKSSVLSLWKIMIFEAYSKFQTIENFEITFVEAARVFLWNADSRSFSAETSIIYNVTNTRNVNEYFSNWVYSLNSTTKFDIVVLFTGGKVNGLKIFSIPESFCKIDHTEKTFLPTITIRIDKLSLHDYKDFVEALWTVLSAKRSTDFNQTTCLQKRTLENEFPLEFTLCEKLLLRQHILSETGSCFQHKPSASRNFQTTQDTTTRNSTNQIIKNVEIMHSTQETTENTYLTNSNDKLLENPNSRNLTETTIQNFEPKTSTPATIEFTDSRSFNEGTVETADTQNSTQTTNGNNNVVAVTVVSLVVILGVLLCLYKILRLCIMLIARKKMIEITASRESQHETTNSCVNAETSNPTSSSSIWEFPSDRLSLGHVLGSGAFGLVYEAVATGILEPGKATTVAVKTVLDGADDGTQKALEDELNTLCHLGPHLNIVNLLGICKTSKLHVILEYCKYGNIRQYLLDNRKNFVFETCTFEKFVSTLAKEKAESSSTRVFSSAVTRADCFDTIRLFSWAYQIAQGMEFLTSRRVLHGDLAARNVLLAENYLVKVCDFGLSRKLKRAYGYNYMKQPKKELLPYKWMALESITSGLYTPESDSWAFGVVLWEIFSLGDRPYPAMEVDMDFIEKLTNGYRMDKPKYASESVYEIMLKCWDANPSNRPTFTDLIEEFGSEIGHGMESFYQNLNQRLQEKREMLYNNGDYINSNCQSTVAFDAKKAEISIYENNCRNTRRNALENSPTCSINVQKG